jgi:hypothetical protein
MITVKEPVILKEVQSASEMDRRLSFSNARQASHAIRKTKSKIGHSSDHES